MKAIVRVSYGEFEEARFVGPESLRTADLRTPRKPGFPRRAASLSKRLGVSATAAVQNRARSDRQLRSHHRVRIVPVTATVKSRSAQGSSGLEFFDRGSE